MSHLRHLYARFYGCLGWLCIAAWTACSSEQPFIYGTLRSAQCEVARTDLQGQLADFEFELIKEFAQQHRKIIVLTGSLAETDLGLFRRQMAYDAKVLDDRGETLPVEDLREKQRLGFLQYPYRYKKLWTSPTPDGSDLDLWLGPEEDGLDAQQRQELLTQLNSYAQFHAEVSRSLVLDEGYDLKRYKNLETFLRISGALVFDGKHLKDGNVVVRRIPAPWQRPDSEWPSALPEEARLLPDDEVGDETDN